VTTAARREVCAIMQEVVEGGKVDVETVISEARNLNAAGWPGRDMARLDLHQFEEAADELRCRYRRVNVPLAFNWIIRTCVLYGVEFPDVVAQVVEVNRFGWELVDPMLVDGEGVRNRQLSPDELMAAIEMAQKCLHGNHT